MGLTTFISFCQNLVSSLVVFGRRVLDFMAYEVVIPGTEIGFTVAECLFGAGVFAVLAFIVVKFIVPML